MCLVSASSSRLGDSGEGGTVSILDEFRRGEDMSSLPLVLGLLPLGGWVLSFNCPFSPFERHNLIPI
jgi:hypothetical protein